jgi:hypothetical protein
MYFSKSFYKYFTLLNIILIRFYFLNKIVSFKLVASFEKVI